MGTKWGWLVVFLVGGTLVGCDDGGGGGTTPIVTVTSPAGGETWFGAEQHDITWTVNFTLDNVDIYYHDGTDWWLIEAGVSTSEGHSYTWTVPDVDIDPCRIRVRQSGGTTEDESADFTLIARSFTFTSPSGGETFYGSGTYALTWVTVGTMDTVDLAYWSGGSYTVIESGVTNTGTYDWTVPDAVDQAASHIRIQCAGHTDISADFDIAQGSITIEDPISATVWCTGSTQYVSWTAQGPSELKIEFSRLGNWSDTVTLADPVDAAQGWYEWDITGTGSTTARIRVRDSADNVPSAESDAFTISDITLTAPAGGEGWVIGESADVSWTAVGVSSVDVELTRLGDWSDTEVIGTGVGSSPWTWDPVTGTSESTTCLVRVVDAGGSGAEDEMAVPFTIWNGCWKVDPYATGTPDGRTWENAFLHPQDAIDATEFSTQKEIWVAAETYIVPGSETEVVWLIEDNDMYGGFAGYEFARSERDPDPATNGTVLDGESTYRVGFAATNTVVDGFTVTNGLTTGSGAGFIAGDTSTFANCRFTSNTVDDAGAAIYAGPTSPNLTVTNCDFVGNAVTGASVSGGGGAVFAGTGLQVTDSYFEDNSSSTDGGALRLEGDSISISGTDFVSNYVDDGDFSRGGGAIYATGSGGTVVTLQSCNFLTNHAYLSANGGGIFHRGSVFDLTDCTFDTNDAYCGGGISSDSGSVSLLTNCTFDFNTARANGGGAYAGNGTFDADGCTISNNTAATDGGGLYAMQCYAGGTHLVDLVNTDIVYNVATAGDGGGVWSGASEIAMDGCLLEGNLATAGTGGGLNIRGNTFDLCNITSCTFATNLSDTAGGGLHAGRPDELSVENCLFQDNATAAAAGMGGGVYNQDSTTSVTYTNCVFNGNQALYGGGMANESEANCAVYHCTFSSNESWLGQGGEGGALYNLWAGTNVLVMNSILYGDLADSYPEVRTDGAACDISASDVDPAQPAGEYSETIPNIALDPLFVVADDELHLQVGSPCIDRCSDVGVADDYDWDMRPLGGGAEPYDMGADEVP